MCTAHVEECRACRGYILIVALTGNKLFLRVCPIVFTLVMWINAKPSFEVKPVPSVTTASCWELCSLQEGGFFYQPYVLWNILSVQTEDQRVPIETLQRLQSVNSLTEQNKFKNISFVLFYKVQINPMLYIFHTWLTENEFFDSSGICK